MSINDIMNYVSQTPGNTNPSVIRSMVEREVENGQKDVVKYTPQSLTDEQKAQARENIGADYFIKTTQEVLVSEAVCTSSYEIDPALNIAVGDSLTVIFNGVEYNCTVMGSDGFFSFGDLMHDTYPFAYIGAIGDTGTFYTSGDEPKTFSIIKNITSIEQRYLPTKIVDFDGLGLTAPILESFNSGGGITPIGSSWNEGINIIEEFPMDGQYIAKLTIPDMGVYYVNPVYTLFDEQGFELAHFDSYIEQNGQLIKFYVQVYRPGRAHLDRAAVKVGFFT